MATDAERFAAALGNDGQHWETSDGVHFTDLADIFGARREHENFGVSGAPVRYIFPDGSVIVEAGDAWDFEGDEEFSWRG
jgi:hypothetical protein